MPEWPRFSPRIPSRQPPSEPPRGPSAPAAPPIREADPIPHFEAIPEVRPDLGSVERPTIEQVVDMVLRPGFLANELVSANEFVAGLKSGAELLAARPDNPAAAEAATVVEESLADKELLDACCLFLLKG